MADKGDGVWYHGSYEDAHGLYSVTLVAPPNGRHSGSRYSLSSPTFGVLHNVRRESFEVLIHAKGLRAP